MVLRVSLLFLAGFLVSCREEAKQVAAPAPPLAWEIEPGEEWLYDVTTTYLKGATPKVWSADEVLSEKNGRVVLNFQRLKSYRGRQEMKPGKGSWDVIRHSRGGKIEEYVYLGITPKSVAFWGSKIEGDSPKPIMNLSVPMDLFRKAARGGDSWQYQLGQGDSAANRRTFRVTGIDRVSVPAGEFDATRIIADGHSRDMEVKETYWFHPEAGFVKIEKVYYGPDTIFKQETVTLRERRIRLIE